MATQHTSSQVTWQELERSADAIVPADIEAQIPIYLDETGRALRIRGSRVTLPVLIGLYRNGDSVDFLVEECYPHVNRTHIKEIITYYDSPAGRWIDAYLDALDMAWAARDDDFKHRFEAGEFPPRRFTQHA